MPSRTMSTPWRRRWLVTRRLTCPEDLVVSLHYFQNFVVLECLFLVFSFSPFVSLLFRGCRISRHSRVLGDGAPHDVCISLLVCLMEQLSDKPNLICSCRLGCRSYRSMQLSASRCKTPFWCTSAGQHGYGPSPEKKKAKEQQGTQLKPIPPRNRETSYMQL